MGHESGPLRPSEKNHQPEPRGGQQMPRREQRQTHDGRLREHAEPTVVVPGQQDDPERYRRTEQMFGHHERRGQEQIGDGGLRPGNPGAKMGRRWQLGSDKKRKRTT